jgi:DNA-directed RNA polymerase subunit E'/Rpb7
MFDTKVLETTIDLFDPSEIYATDPVKLIKDKLNARYVGICFSSILITEITDIIRYSDFRLVDNHLNGAAYVDVQFRVKGFMLVKGEVLHGCKVVQITNTGVFIDHPYASGMMQPDTHKRVIGLIRKDQIVPVIVQNVRYNIGKSQISIICTPYIPTVPKVVYYNITDHLSADDTDKVDDLLNRIEEEKKLHESIKSNKSYIFFKNIMYPFKTQQKFTESKIGEKFAPVEETLKSLLTIKDGCLVMPENSSPIYLSKQKLDTDAVQIIDSPYYPAISEMLLQRLMNLTTLRLFTEQYDTVEKTQSMLPYWKVCTSLKV